MSKLFDLITESLEELGPDEFDNDFKPDTELFGGKSTLDSLGLVTFLTSLEQKIDDKLGIAFTIADDRAFSMKNSPFRTIRSLEEFLNQKIIENE